LRLEGNWVAAMRGIAHRLFGALAHGGVQPILITQGSSGHSLCFAVAPGDLERARASIAEEFELEQRAGWIDELVVETDCSVIAAVGEAMRETPGVSGRLFGVLGRSGVNVRAIAQGSSELNISVVVAERDHTRALRAIHDAFFFPTVRSVKVFIAGVGRVGGALVDQILTEADDLKARTGIGIAVAGVADSRRAAISAEGLETGRWRDALRSAGEGAQGLERLVEAATSARDAPRVFVDCTASAALAERYARLVRARMAVVSANKLGFSGPLAQYRALRAAANDGLGLYYETTVGAGLPVLRTIADLIATGDRVRRVEGVLSGTLGFVCDSLMAGTAFHEAVRTAHERGWTEPDPREDLSGGDVARKILILARESGFEVDPESVETCPLLEGDLVALPLAEFWEQLPQADEALRQRAQAARARGRRLCYLASFESGRSRVGLEEVAADHPCATLRGTDNLIVIHSDRYAETPLVIRGPGAGPEVTAGGLFADILRAVRESLW
jgi:aspartokinase/homoserine dehydrogenase 1